MGVNAFRLWSMDTAQMIRLETSGVDCLIELSKRVSFEQGEYVLMECTGLMDNKKNVLYVGDICQGQIAIGCMVSEPKLGEVIYNPAEARYELRTAESSVPLTMVNNMQLLGTVYETPELLHHQSEMSE
jgi:YopX protein